MTRGCVVSPTSSAQEWQRLVGGRVVVRHRTPDGASTDVVGLLETVTTTSLVLRRDPGRRPASRDATGASVVVALADVLAGKAVPPRPSRPAPPHRALGVVDLESVTALHWRALDRARWGGWLLRASGGFTSRGNSLLPLGEPDRPPTQAVHDARAWYAARGLPALACLPRVAAGGVALEGAPFEAAAAALADDGWRVVDGAGALVLTAATAGLRSSAPAGHDHLGGLTWDLQDRPDDAWLAAYRYRGSALPPAGLALLLSAAEQVFASVRDGSRTVAVARGSVAGGWAGLTAVEVDPGYRRRGLATALLGMIAAWASRRGAAATYLQVGLENLVAQAMYTAAGFEVHHAYDYLAYDDLAYDDLARDYEAYDDLAHDYQAHDHRRASA